MIAYHWRRRNKKIKEEYMEQMRLKMLEELEKQHENESDHTSAKASQNDNERSGQRRIRNFGSSRKVMGGDSLLNQMKLGIEK